MSRKEQYRKYKFGDKQPWLTPFKTILILIFIITPLLAYFKINNNYEVTCWEDRTSTIKAFGTDIEKYNTLFSKISKTSWIKNKSDYIDQFSLAVDRIEKFYSKIQKFTESEYKSSCTEISKELAFSNKFTQYSEDLNHKIDEIELAKDVTRKEFNCHDQESCDIILEDKLRVLNWNPNPRKDEINKDIECQGVIEKNKAQTEILDELIQKIVNKINNAKWIQSKNEYNQSLTLLKQKIDFNQKRYVTFENNLSTAICDTISESLSSEGKLYADFVKINNYIESLESNIDRIKRESSCKNDLACNQILNDKFKNATKSIFVEWNNHFKIEQTIDNKNNCYVNKDKLIESAKNNLDIYSTYNQTIIGTDWITDKDKYLGKLRDLSEELKNDYSLMLKQDKSEFNQECSKYDDMISVGDDLSKYLNHQIKTIAAINKDYSLENNSICKKQSDCRATMEARFEAEIKPKSIILGSKYNDIEGILTAVYPNCYKQKDEMIKFVESLIQSRKTLISKLKNNSWVGNINEVEQNFNSENTNNEKYKQYLTNSSQDEVNKNCGGWPTIYNNYKKDLKLIDFISSSIDLINTSKDDILKKSNCTDLEVCNSVLKRKLGVAILPVISESQNKPLMNKFK